MFKNLFRGRGKAAAKVETQRQMFARLMEELNGAIDDLPEKPKVTIDPATGHVTLDLPEQLPDEALALPSPEEKPKATDAEPQEEEKEAA